MRRARRSTIVLTAVFVLSAFVEISAMMLLASPASVQKEMIQYKALMDSQVAFRLTWWR